MNTIATSGIFGLLRTVRTNRELIAHMVRREVIGRYQGSVAGVMWSFFHPLLMLAVYTFVFSVVFKARWPQSGIHTDANYAVALFAGLIMYTLFVEVLNRSPMLVISNGNYVKKVVFPLELLSVISVLTGLFHFAVSTLVLIAATVIARGTVPITALLLPVIVVPFAVLTLGFSWFLASLGVFIRDVGQTIGILTMVMMFLAPIVYPASAVPQNLRVLLQVNPLTFPVEQVRAVMLWGQSPDWTGLALYTIIAIAVALLGFRWFQKTRAGFADVL